jgi:hypothetical protein
MVSSNPYKSFKNYYFNTFSKNNMKRDGIITCAFSYPYKWLGKNNEIVFKYVSSSLCNYCDNFKHQSFGKLIIIS